jgi:hypothetical protein
MIVEDGVAVNAINVPPKRGGHACDHALGERSLRRR